MVDIKGYEGYYQISEDGKVLCIKKNRFGVPKNKFIKIGVPDRGGYYRVELNRDCKGVKFHVHRLVCQAYHENPKNKPFVNHKDGNKLNNHKDNLEWCTHQENIQHAIDTGLRNTFGEKNGNHRLKKDEVLEIRRLCAEGKQTQNEIGKKFKLDQRNVSRIYKRRLWGHLV